MGRDVSRADILKEIQLLKNRLQDLGIGETDQSTSEEVLGPKSRSDLALNLAPIAVFEVLNGVVLHPNEETARIYNRPKRDLVKRGFLDFVMEEDRERVGEYLESVQKSGGSTGKCVYRMETDEDVEQWLELTAVKLGDDPDKGLICYQTDVSDLYRLKENLEIYSEHLEESVKLRTNELRNALEKAEVANKLKDIFLQNMSHEFRTPIHQINSLSEIGFDKAAKSLKKKVDPLIEKMADYFLDINNASKKLFSFILNLFDLSTLESGEVKYYFRLSNLNKALDTFREDLKELLREKNINLVFEKPEGMVSMECDVSLIKKALKHILENSIKFSPGNSEVRMVLRSQRTGQSGEGEEIIIEVQDESVGVPENELEMIFEKFTQSSRTDDGSGGKGIGLAICSQIVREHQGRIWAENRPGKGLLTTIIFPATQSVQIESTIEGNDINEITF